MPATSVREPEISSHTGERPLDLVGASELDLADRLAWQMLQGAQNVRRWFWTVVLVALALLVVGFLTQSP